MDARDDSTLNPGLRAYQRRVAREKDQTIIDAAIQLFLEKGYGATGMAEIASLAEVSPATLYKHYHGKEALFAATIAELRQRLTSDAPVELDALPLDEALTVFLSHYVALLADPRTLALLRLMISEASRHPSVVHAFYEHGKSTLFLPLASRLRVAAESNELELPGEDIPMRQLLSMAEGHVILRGLLAGETGDAEHHRSIVEEAVQTFLARYRRR